MEELEEIGMRIERVLDSFVGQPVTSDTVKRAQYMIDSITCGKPLLKVEINGRTLNVYKL